MGAPTIHRGALNQNELRWGERDMLAENEWREKERKIERARERKGRKTERLRHRYSVWEWLG